jgi:hypothetical protein
MLLPHSDCMRREVRHDTFIFSFKFHLFVCKYVMGSGLKMIEGGRYRI